VAAFGLSGCSPDAPPPATAPPAPPGVGVSQPTGLPTADALTDVLARLVDPAVPGSDKVTLVEAASGVQAADLDRFAKALQDNRMSPMTFTATDLVWSPGTPGDVTANVTATPDDPNVAPFSFPMEFTAKTGPWQLSRQTVDLLLAVSGETQSSSPPATPMPSPTPTPTP
jgi:hypothetical protein